MEHLVKKALKLPSCQVIRSSGVTNFYRSCSYYNNKPAEEVSNNKSTTTAGEARRFETNNNNIDQMSGVAGFVADTAVGAAKVAETFGDMAKETVDKAWDSAKNATRDVQDTVIAAADENVVDTSEYRSFEDRKNNNNNNNIGLERKEDWEKFYN